MSCPQGYEPDWFSRNNCAINTAAAQAINKISIIVIPICLVCFVLKASRAKISLPQMTWRQRFTFVAKIGQSIPQTIIPILYLRNGPALGLPAVNGILYYIIMICLQLYLCLMTVIVSVSYLCSSVTLL